MIGPGIATEETEERRGVMLDETMMIGDRLETEICSKDAMTGIGADVEVEAIAMSSLCSKGGRARARHQRRRNRLQI
jgi:hypothetical protein